MEAKTSTFTAMHGVMTNEVGVISGELELTTTCQEDGKLELTISYVGSTDVYTLLDKDYQLHDIRNHKVLHRMIVAIIERY